MSEEKIIQIIPAPSNLYAIYEDEEGEFYSKVICIALTNKGDVVMMDTDELGEVWELTNHKHIVFNNI